MNSELWSRHTGSFLVHGDLWANNVLFSKDDSVILVDWQCLATANPLIDFGNIAFLSMDWEDTERNMDNFISTYFTALSDGVQEFGDEVTLPWKDEDDFRQELMSDGSMATFLWSVTAYQNADRYPRLKMRIFSLFRQAFKNNSDLFKL